MRYINPTSTVNNVLNVHINHKAYLGRGSWGEGGREVGGEGDYIPITTLSPPECIKVGKVKSHFNVSLIVRDKVTGQCPQTTTFEEKGEPKRIRPEVPLHYQPSALPLGHTGPRSSSVRSMAPRD